MTMTDYDEKENYDRYWTKPSQPTPPVFHYCAWDGFIASEPGHPILERAIEIIISIVLLFDDDDYDIDSMNNDTNTSDNSEYSKITDEDIYHRILSIVLSLSTTITTTTTTDTNISTDKQKQSQNNKPEDEEVSFVVDNWSHIEVWKLRALFLRYKRIQKQQRGTIRPENGSNGLGCILGMAINHIQQRPDLLSNLVLGRQRIPLTNSDNDDKNNSTAIKEWGDINILLVRLPELSNVFSFQKIKRVNDLSVVLIYLCFGLVFVVRR
jgi:hypothetical protein